MTKKDAIFYLSAAAIALISNVIIWKIQGNSTIKALAFKSVVPTILAIVPFVLGTSLIENKTSVLFGAFFGIAMTALLWGFAIYISVIGQAAMEEDTGPIVLFVSMPFIVTSTFLTAALLKAKLSSR